MSPGTPASPDALAAFVLARRGVPFVWGQSDCALFVCDWLIEAAGIDPAARVRGTYDTAAGARIVLSQWGGFGGFARAAGMVSVERPARGDVGAIRSRPEDVLAICLGGTSGWVFQGRKGIALVTRPLVRRAWAWPRP